MTCLRLLARYLHVSLRAASKFAHSCFLLANSSSVAAFFSLVECSSLHEPSLNAELVRKLPVEGGSQRAPTCRLASDFAGNLLLKLKGYFKVENWSSIGSRVQPVSILGLLLMVEALLEYWLMFHGLG